MAARLTATTFSIVLLALSVGCGAPGPGADGGLADAAVDGGSGPGDGGTDPCVPNPCTDEAGHRTRCLWDGAGGHACRCDVSYHDDQGLCCPAFSSNVQGACACLDGYGPDADGACVVRCSEDSIEGLTGWCPPGELCVQGACVVDVCTGVTCPEHGACVIRAGAPFCLCDQGYASSGGLCCPENAVGVNGACACAEGYLDQGGTCVPDSQNPCLPVNPCTDAGLHRETCVPGGSSYQCACNQGYEDQAGACVLSVRERCPDTLVCRADVCVPGDLAQEQCLVDADCREFYPEAPTYCNEAAAGGICLGCTQPSDCPGNTQCTDFGTCALLCDDDADCFYGRCATTVGYCVQSYCTSDADCAGGTTCIDEDGDGRGLCLRIPCTEVACSPTNPGGTCPNPGEACLYGGCVSSCTPNPCTGELNKDVCTLVDGVPGCTCAAGYALAADGRCLPAATACTEGFTCGEGVCAARTEGTFVCQTDADCGAGLTCSPNLPSGSCSGCELGKPCPGGLSCLSGYCLQPCTLHDECHPEMTCRGTGYCGRKPCSVPGDCAAPYVCVEGASGGTCQRPLCEG